MEMIGRTISHYRILAKLGEGGMGVVYKAEDTRLGRAVALKFLSKRAFGVDDRERLIREAQAAAALDHPGICTIYEIGGTDDETFIAMAYIDGESLENRISRGPMKMDEALDVAAMAAEGLQAAHDKGVVHRDIKSANIMMTPGGQVRIMDFGLAKLPGRSKLTTDGTMMGTARYLSPEQAEGGKVDRRTDIWSLGVVLYEMLTGRPPFAGEYEQAIVYRILNTVHDPVTGLRTGVPLDLERIVDKCLAKSPDERYQTAADLAADLRRLARSAVPEGVPGAGSAAARVTGNRRSAGARRYYAGAVILIVMAAALVLTMRRGGGERDLKSIAVLPFENMSDSREDEYFSDGITEDIIAHLSKIADLKVISRTSVLGYKGSGRNIREIGSELGVGTILEGSVRRAGNRVRIVAQLIDARGEGHIWSDTYDKEMTEIFAIQSDVAQKIAAALKATLLPGERNRIEKQQTRDLTAYDLYLRGRQLYCRYSRGDNETAIILFRQAIEVDPGYALAWAGLGDAYAQRRDKYGYPPAWSDSVIAAGSRAISLDPKLAEGYKTLGLGYQGKGFYGKALEAYRRGYALNPSFIPALANTGWIALFTGRLAEAERTFLRVIELEPNLAFDYMSLAYVYIVLGDYRAARSACARALEVQPGLLIAYIGLSYIAAAENDMDGAVVSIEKAVAADPLDFSALSCAGEIYLMAGDMEKAEKYFRSAVAIDSLGENTLTMRYPPIAGIAYILWQSGKREEAGRIFDGIVAREMERLERGDESFPTRYKLACVSAIRGDRAAALDWLGKSVDAGWRFYYQARRDRCLENLRGERRFDEILARAETLVDAERKLIGR